jgi:hypothetical protein
MKITDRRSLFGLCMALATVAAAGCTVGGKSFQIDSNSRIPFFGLELRERKPKSIAPSYDSISLSPLDGPRIDTAVNSGSATSRERINGENKRPGSASVLGLPGRKTTSAISLSREPSQLQQRQASRPGNQTASNLTTPNSEAAGRAAESLSLPRTDTDPASVQTAAASTIDFQ